MNNPYDSFLRGELPFAEFAKAVAPSYSFSFRATERETRSLHPTPPTTVIVREESLVPVLRSFLAGRSSAEMVSVWAFVIATVDAFDLSALREDTVEALSSLSFAPITTQVTPDVVEGVLHLCERGE